MKTVLKLLVIYTILYKHIGFAKNRSNMGDTIDFTRQQLPLVNVNYSERNPQVQFSEDGLLNFTELSRKYIRPAEEYDVTTEDSYILKLFRIPGNTSSVVLVCHGIFCSSDDFLVRGKTSLIYMMADKGFDVWAMNCRGNAYSRRHVKLNPDTDRRFWQYTMHEMGVYDYKAIIDFILRKTGQKQLSIVAHSEGTSAFFILASEKPEYNKRVKVFAGLAPIVYLQHSRFGLKALLNFSPLENIILKALTSEEIFGYHSHIKKAIVNACLQGMAGYELCFNGIFGTLTGFNEKNIEQDFASTILGHIPAGTSLKNLNHYGTNYYANKFQQYDYGLLNFAVYGSVKPPAYNLSKVTTNVALYAAKGDKVVDIKDIVRLKTELPNVLHYQVISDDKFNHIDYMWGRNAHVVLYQCVIDLLLKYN